LVRPRGLRRTLKKVHDVHPNAKTNKKKQKRFWVLFNFKRRCVREKKKTPLMNGDFTMLE
jgi:hypothetical protein